MKKYLMLAVAALIAAAPAALNGQAKKPSLMVLPDDTWMTQNGYMTKVDNQGEETYVPDYNKALNENPNLKLVINKIGGMFAERGFTLVDLSAKLASLKTKAAEDAVNTSKSGAAVATNPMDQLLQVARPDIAIKLMYKLKQTGPKKSVTFDLTAIDAYSLSNVANAQGTGLPTIGGDEDVLLEEAVLSHVDNFAESLQTYFDDILANGRIINLDIKVWDSAGIDLEEEFDGTELGEIIDDWVNENTQEHRYTNNGGTEYSIEFTDVRMPLYNEKGKANDARAFAQKLRKFLAAAPYNLVCKVQPRGQGRAIVAIGEK